MLRLALYDLDFAAHYLIFQWCVNFFVHLREATVCHNIRSEWLAVSLLPERSILCQTQISVIRTPWSVERPWSHERYQEDQPISWTYADIMLRTHRLNKTHGLTSWETVGRGLAEASHVWELYAEAMAKAGNFWQSLWNDFMNDFCISFVLSYNTMYSKVSLF